MVEVTTGDVIPDGFRCETSDFVVIPGKQQQWKPDDPVAHTSRLTHTSQAPKNGPRPELSNIAF